MTNFTLNAARWSIVATVAVISWTALAAEPEYIQEDAKISGKEILAFADGEQNVSVVLGGFHLTLGERTLTGRDAVLWIIGHDIGQVQRYDLVIYVEGDAKVVEAGATTTDKTMLITLHCQGRLTAEGLVSKRELKDFPLYQRAVAAREAPVEEVEPETQRPAPDLIMGREGVPATGPGPSTMAATGPAAPTTGAAATSRPTAEQVAEKTLRPVTPGKKPVRKVAPPPQPVNFSADSFTSQRIGEQRITIAKGNVYLSQGNPKSELFLELRSQTAVVFTAPAGAKSRPADKDVRSPFSPKAAAGAAGGEAILGVYLEGDVIIARGDRTMQGRVAYYDFTVDRAIILEPVFRGIQEQRNIPIYIRAKEARMLSAREVFFQDAQLSSSDFYTPSYSIGAKSLYLMDTTPYDEKGVRLGEQSMQAEMKDITFNIDSLPIFYWPYTQTDVSDSSTALRSVHISEGGKFGAGVETDWNLFRMLGLIKPAGYDATLGLEAREELSGANVNYHYLRPEYTGYGVLEGYVDTQKKDNLGRSPAYRDVEAPEDRGRLLMRHKQYLADDWQLQFELSWISDKNYLQRFSPNEFRAGKEQETLLYAKKQRDNWAFDALLKYRLNDFQSQSEAYPDLGLYLIGEPLLGDRLTFFSESHAGLMRWHAADDSGMQSSDVMARLDSREEINAPLHLGPVNLVPYGVGRGTWWSDTPDGGGEGRPYGQAGAKANMNIWRVYDVDSRVFDLHNLKHVITPEAVAFFSGAGGVSPTDLFPLDPDIEQHLDGRSGGEIGVTQRLQTKRGSGDNRTTVDWMRLKVSVAFYDSVDNTPLTDGRFFLYRPEYSIGRNAANFDYEWQISPTTLLTAFANYDLDRSDLALGGIQLAVSRTPRLQYLLGLRTIQDMNSTLATVGATYQLTRKYSLSVIELYDLDFHGGQTQGTAVTITRKIDRWYFAVVGQFDQASSDRYFGISVWPEGLPEMMVGQTHTALLGHSTKN